MSDAHVDSHRLLLYNIRFYLPHGTSTVIITQESEWHRSDIYVARVSQFIQGKQQFFIQSSSVTYYTALLKSEHRQQTLHPLTLFPAASRSFCGSLARLVETLTLNALQGNDMFSKYIAYIRNWARQRKSELVTFQILIFHSVNTRPKMPLFSS